MTYLLDNPEAWRASCRKTFDLADDAAVGVLAPSIKEIRVDTEKGKRDVVFVANTADVDLEDEVVVPEGADTSHIERNGQAFADHSYDLASNVGSIRATTLQHGRWVQRVFVYDKPGNKALCDDILYVADHGGIGASIGFVAIDHGPPDEKDAESFEGREVRSVVRRWKWLETSFTAMPCNVACQSLRAEATDARLADLDEMVTKGRIQRKSAVLLGLPESPSRRYYAVRPPRRQIVVVG